MPPSERIAHGLQGDSRERARKVALEGQGAPDTAQRGIPLGVNEGGTTQSAASFGGEAVCVFFPFRHKGRHAYEFSGGYDSGNLRLASGAADVFSDKLCHREKNVPQMKLLGVALAVVGALMVFTV